VVRVWLVGATAIAPRVARARGGRPGVGFPCCDAEHVPSLFGSTHPAIDSEVTARPVP